MTNVVVMETTIGMTLEAAVVMTIGIAAPALEGDVTEMTGATMMIVMTEMIDAAEIAGLAHRLSNALRTHLGGGSPPPHEHPRCPKTS